MSTFFGFAVADGMFEDGAVMTRRVIDIEAVRAIVQEGVVPALNPSHTATIEAMHQRFGLAVEIPESAPKISLTAGDRMIVMSVRGLPRREGGKAEYTTEEIEAASFEFSVWEVLAGEPAPITSEEAQRLFELVSKADDTAAYLSYPAFGPYSVDPDIQFLAEIQEKLGMETVGGYIPDRRISYKDRPEKPGRRS